MQNGVRRQKGRMEWFRENLIMSRHFVTKSAFTGNFRRSPAPSSSHDDPFTRFYRCKEKKNVEFDFVQWLLSLNIEKERIKGFRVN